MENKPLASTFECGFKDERFASLANPIPVPAYLEKLPRQKFNPLIEWRLFTEVLKASQSAKTLLLFSSRGYLKPELLAIILLGFLPRTWRPSIVLYGEMFEPNGGFSGWVEKFVMKLVNRGVSLYWVYSSKELDLFPELWGVESEKMRFCPFYLDPERTHLSQVANTSQHHQYLFSGGNSHRNYEPLLEAAHQLPEYQFVFATAKELTQEDIPENVTVSWPSLEDYIQLMNQAAAIILPMRTDLHRTVGLLTLLEAMSLEQAVIASNAMGIADYIQNGQTGIIVDGTPDEYVKAIQWALDPINAYKLSQIRRAAKTAILEQFSIHRLVDKLLPIIDEAFAIKKSWQ